MARQIVPVQDTGAQAGNEAAFLSRLRAGDAGAFETLVREHQGPLYSLLSRLMGNPDEALDLVQETFIRALRGLPSFRGESALRTWLYRIAMNEFLNGQRGRRTEAVAPEEMEDLAPSLWDRWRGRVPDPEEVAVTREELEKLRQAIARLPEEYRAVLLLRDREGYSAQETAELLGISIPAVKSRLHRARLFVRKRLIEGSWKR